MLTAATAAVVAVTGCANPFPGIQFTPEETITPTGMENTPYPADLEHLDDILTLGKTTLPEGTTDITITPATKFAESYPGGWGYVITYHTDPQPIRNHIDTYTDLKEIISRVIQTLRLSCISKILISPTLNTLLSSVLAK